MKRIIIYLICSFIFKVNAQGLPACNSQIITAASLNNYSDAKEFLSAGGNPNCIEDERLLMTPLHYVTTTFLFSNYYENEQDRINFAELLFAFKAQVSINFQNKYGKTPLLLSLNGNFAPKLVQFLLDNGANPNVTDNEGHTPLHIATIGFSVHVEYVDILIKAGASVDVRGGAWLATPLLYAAGYEKPEVISRLLQAHPDLEISDKFGRTPLIFASQSRKGVAAVNLKLLLDAGANVNATDNQGGTALIYAKQHGDQESIDLLLNHGAN